MMRRAIGLTLVILIVSFGVPLIGTPQGAAAPGLLVGRTHASYQPSKGKIFVLVIGNDARVGNPDNVRADAIHLVGLNTTTLKGGILNFPRDSWVPIPGYRTGRINEALVAGGPERLVQTVESLTGIAIDYWIMVGFEDFRNIISDLGGIRMHLPTDVYDPGGSGAALQAGTQTLLSGHALAYVRTRKAFGRGDIDRTTNQATFMLAMLRKFRKETQVSPAAMFRWTSIARTHARLDISPGELFRIGVLASQVRTRDVGSVTVPVSLGSAGAASVVFISSSAQAIYERFKANGSL